MNPGIGGVIQRRARARPNDCTLPAAASESSARCTVRWLAPSASARAELDHDSPSARKASTAACSLLDRPRQHDDLARAARRKHESSLVALTSASVRSAARSRPISTRNRARCDSSVNFARNARARSVPSARPRATLRRARVPARTIPDGSRARPPCLRRARHDGTRPRRARSTPATLRPPRAGEGAPRRAQSAAPRASSGRGTRFDLRHQRRNSRVARGTPGPSERGARRLRPEAPDRDPRNDQFVGGPRRGREGRGVELGKHPLRLVEASDQQQAPDLEIPRMRGVQPVAMLLRASPVPRRAPSQASPDRARPARSRPRRRRISRGPRPLSGRRRAPRFAEEPWLERNRRAAPSRCHEAPAPARRRAARPASSAPSGSPAASARAAAVINESIGIPPHLSLPPFDARP